MRGADDPRHAGGAAQDANKVATIDVGTPTVVLLLEDAPVLVMAVAIATPADTLGLFPAVVVAAVILAIGLRLLVATRQDAPHANHVVHHVPAAHRRTNGLGLPLLPVGSTTALTSSEAKC